MVEYNLTDKQRDILRAMVDAERRQAGQFYYPPRTFTEEGDLISHPGMSPLKVAELDVVELERQHLLTRQGMLLQLTQRAFDAVDNDFKDPSAGIDTLRDNLHEGVRANLIALVTCARENGIEDQEFAVFKDHATWTNTGHTVGLKGSQPLQGLVELGLLNPPRCTRGGDKFYTITPRGFLAVDKDFNLSLTPAVPLVDIQVGPRITTGDIINSQAVIAADGQVQVDLGGENAELYAAVARLEDALNKDARDRPGILSTLSQVLMLLINAPEAIEAVRPLIVAALRAVGILS